MKNITSCLVVTSLVLGCASFARADWITLNDPLATAGTLAYGVSGNTVAGYYNDASGTHGFYYQNGTYTTLNDPNSTGQTVALGISGNNIVGYYGTGAGGQGNPQSFEYNILTKTYTNISEGPNASTVAMGIDGTKIVGYYQQNGQSQVGFVYDGSDFLPLSQPYRNPTGISGSNIVGYDSSFQGFLYNGSSYTALNDPASPSGILPGGISGNNIVGSFRSGDQGFVYNIASGKYQTIDDPSATTSTSAQGIDGDTIVGYYKDSTGTHGFIDTSTLVSMPEPTGIAMMSFGMALGGGYFRFRWRKLAVPALKNPVA